MKDKELRNSYSPLRDEVLNKLDLKEKYKQNNSDILVGKKEEGNVINRQDTRHSLKI